MTSNLGASQLLTMAGTLGLPLVSVLLLCFLALVFSSYVKIATVLGIVRAGFGFYSFPSALATTGLALALSFLVMYPTLDRAARAMDQVAREGYGEVERQARVVDAGVEEWRRFVSTHAHDEEQERFAAVAAKLAQGSEATEQHNLAEAWQVLAPAFLVSELKEAFSTGLSIFLPLLVIDLLVANILAALGLVQLSPMLVAFPFKLMLFVLVDGWSLVTTNLVTTYAGA